ncbi:transposase [Enterobacter sp.]|uniref:transposase n=1 Tax=Enterobacter sp. TaxID=42895 RepID=UPI00296E7B89|nr:transposase [Enterobacter sp.]
MPAGLNKSVAQLLERISTVRRDFLHKLTHRLTCENQALAIEDLNVQGMMAKPKPGAFLPNGASRKRGLSRSLADRRWQSPEYGTEMLRDINAALNIAPRSV